MTAKGNVIPGTTYHIKLVIADEENIRYDSAIFLGGGSFHVGTDIGPDRLIATNNPICEGETYKLDATEPGTNTYQWFKNNSPITGETNATYDVTASGTYSVEINLGGTGCIATGEAVIEYTPAPVTNSPLTLAQCDDNQDGISVFNLPLINPYIVAGNPTIPVVYYESLDDAKNELNPIPNPTAYQNTTTNTVIARVENAFGCPAYAKINLVIANNTIAPQNPVALCDETGTEDGITEFDLNALNSQVLNGLPSGMMVSYYASTVDAVHGANQLPDTFTNTTPNQQIIYAMIVNGPDCYGLIPITLIVHSFSPAAFDDEIVYLCDGTPQKYWCGQWFFLVCME